MSNPGPPEAPSGDDRPKRLQNLAILVGSLIALLLLVVITYTVCFMSLE